MEKTNEEWLEENQRAWRELDELVEEGMRPVERRAELLTAWKGKYADLFSAIFPHVAKPSFNDLDFDKIALKKQRATRNSYSFSVLTLNRTGSDGYLEWLDSVSPSDRRIHEYVRLGMPCRVFFDVEWETETCPTTYEITKVLMDITKQAEHELGKALSLEEGVHFSGKWAVWDGSRPISGGNAWKNSFHLIENTIILEDYGSMRNMAARVNHGLDKSISEKVDFKIYDRGGAWLRLPHNHKSGEEGSLLILNMYYTREFGYGGALAEEEIKTSVSPYHGVYIDKNNTRKKLVKVDPLSKEPFVRKEGSQMNPLTSVNEDYISFSKKTKIEQDMHTLEFEDNTKYSQPEPDTVLSMLKNFETIGNRGYFVMDVQNELCAAAALNLFRAVLPTGAWLAKVWKRELGHTFITYEVVRENYWRLNDITIPVLVEKKNTQKIVHTPILRYINMNQQLTLKYTGGTIFEPWSFTLMPDLFHGKHIYKSMPDYDNCFNRFRGFALDHFPETENWKSDMMAKVDPFLKWIRKTLAYSPVNAPGEEDRLYHSLISRIQDMLRFPGKRLNCVTMFQGQPGVGKTAFVTLISLLLGHQYSIEYNCLEDVEQHFNSSLQDKLLVCINEVTKDNASKGPRYIDSGMTGLPSKVKSLITEDYAVITRKYQESTKDTIWFNLFLTSDRFGRFWMDGLDRRVDFFSCRPWPDNKDKREKAVKRTKAMFANINDLKDPSARLFRHYFFLYCKYFYTRPNDFSYEQASKCSARAIAIRNSYPPEVHHFNVLMSGMHEKSSKGADRWIDDYEHDIHPVVDKVNSTVCVNARSCFVAFINSGQMSEKRSALFDLKTYSQSIQESLRITCDVKKGDPQFIVPRDWASFSQSVSLI